MRFFEKALGKQVDVSGEQMSVYYVDGSDESMNRAYELARETFGYFYRELYWERRRIVPALNLSCVKIAFKDEVDGEEITENMWVNDVNFDGEIVSGVLVNEPNDVKNVKNGDFIQVPLSQITDWIFVINGKSYGGFSVQNIRANMSKEERAEHDKAWGIDFGDFKDILVVFDQKQHPENLKEHPLCRVAKDSVAKYIEENRASINDADELGYTLLHHEAVAGNAGIVEILLQNGADKNLLTKNGKRAIDLARNLNWELVVNLLKD